MCEGIEAKTLSLKYWFIQLKLNVVIKMKQNASVVKLS